MIENDAAEMNCRTYSFNNQMVMSYGVCCDSNVSQILLANIPAAASVTQAEKSDDRHGTDYWVVCSNGHRLSIDVKARKRDFSVDGKDDLALETWSVIDPPVIGWTRNTEKRTDYILWLWKDTKRWCLVPFHLLCAVFIDNWKSWSNMFKCRKQRTIRWNGTEYQSQCVYVPRQLVWRTIYLRFSGCPVAEEGV